MVTAIKAYTLSECMETMARYVEECEARGEKNLVFCEDRLTLIAERAITSRLGGSFDTRVCTFSRFLTAGEHVISKQGSVMAVGEVMAKLQREGRLECFKTTAGIGNNAKCIYETLAQFSASEITAETLQESLVMLPDDTLKRKISDLALIYDGYSAFLNERKFLDESKYLSLLPARIREDKSLKNTNVFFLCFQSFTAQATKTIAAAIERAKNVVGIFASGTEEIYTNRALDTFLRVCKNENEKPEVLEAGIPLEREAETLRCGLFDPERMKKTREETENIRIFEAEDKTAEAEFIAVQIKKAMATDEEMRYRDFAVLVPGISAYALPLKRAFAEFRIPYFVDEKKSLKQHPLSEFLLDCFQVVKQRYSVSSVQSLAQNVFFGESDEYRNYLLKFANYRGGAKREIKTGEAVETLFCKEKLVSGRERLLLATQNVKPRATGKEYCNAVRTVLRDFNVKETLEALEISVSDLAQKGYLSQIYDALDKVLAEAELLTGETVLGVAEFAAVLEDGLDATELSLIPLKNDAVFVGDVTDSRIEKVRVLFAAGMTDEVPRAAGDTAIVSDKEIERLASVQTLLEPTVAEVNLRARESACLNLCTFLDTLYLSYALGADGNEPTVSEVFRYVDACFLGKDGKPLVREKKLKKEDFPYRCSAPTPAIRQLLLQKSEYERRGQDTRLEYSSLYTALDKLSVREKDDYLQEYTGQVCVERGEELFFKNGKISPTALEEYFSCPFRNFVERGLKLKDREETAVLAVDSGNFIHELLERTATEYERVQTEEEMRELAFTLGAGILQKTIYATQADTMAGETFTKKLLEEGAEVATAAYRQIKNSDFVVEETEKSVSTPTMHGKIDRVDGTDKYVRVIDYKTGAIDDSALSYYTGRKLQMQLYMSSIKDERIPAGVFYFPASVSYTDEQDGKFRMRGFLNGDEAALRAGDKDISAEKQSEYFPAALENKRSKRVMDEATFRDFLDYSVHVSRQGTKELKEGYIAPSPYGGSCEYCKYGGMCGFNRDTCSVRNEPTIDAPAIAEIARKIREGETEI